MCPDGHVVGQEGYVEALPAVAPVSSQRHRQAPSPERCDPRGKGHLRRPERAGGRGSRQERAAAPRPAGQGRAGQDRAGHPPQGAAAAPAGDSVRGRGCWCEGGPGLPVGHRRRAQPSRAVGAVRAAAAARADMSSRPPLPPGGMFRTSRTKRKQETSWKRVSLGRRG